MSIRSPPVGDSLGRAVTRRLAVEAEERQVQQIVIERRTGIGQSTISRAFNGRRVFSIDEAARVSEALGLSFVDVIRDALKRK